MTQGHPECAVVGCTSPRLRDGRFCNACNKRRRLTGVTHPEDTLDRSTTEYALTAAETFLRTLKQHTQEHAVRILSGYVPARGNDPEAIKSARLLRPEDVRAMKTSAAKTQPVWARFWASRPNEGDISYTLRPCRFAIAYRLAYRWLLDAGLVGSGVENGWTPLDYAKASDHATARRLIEAVPGGDVPGLSGTAVTQLGTQSFRAIDTAVKYAIGTDHDWLPAIAARDQFDELRSLTIEARKLALAA